MNQTLRHMSLLAVVTTILSFTSLAHGQTGTCTVSNAGPTGAGTLKPATSQLISYTINWTGMPLQQNIKMDVYCTIKNVTSGASSGKVLLLTTYTHGLADGSTGGQIAVQALVTPDGKPGDQGGVGVSVLSNAPGSPQGAISAFPAPSY